MSQKHERYDPVRAAQTPSALSQLLFGSEKRLRGRHRPPEGVYIWGTVGGGKTMLMDLASGKGFSGEISKQICKCVTNFCSSTTPCPPTRRGACARGACTTTTSCKRCTLRCTRRRRRRRRGTSPSGTRTRGSTPSRPSGTQCSSR